MKNSGTGHGERRGRWLWAWALVTLIAAVAALLVGTQVRSPWEDAVENAASPPPVTAEIVELDLPPETVTVAGTVQQGAVVAIAAPSTPGSDLAVVTEMSVDAGDQVGSGDLIGVVSGAAVIALELPFPLYRDLALDDEGPDVVALQESLSVLGLYRGPADGDYGPATAAALSDLFEQVGHPLPEPPVQPTGDQDQQENPSEGAEPSTDGSPSPDDEDLPGSILPLGLVARLSADAAVVATTASVGDVLTSDTPLAQLREGSSFVDARFGVDQAAGIEVGTELELSAVSDPSTIISATVTRIADFEPGAEGELPGYDVRLELPADMSVTDGSEVSILVAGEASGYTGLGVPAIAVQEDPSGTFVVLAAEDGSPSDRMPVEVVGIREGFALINGDGISAGDLVVVPA